VEVVADRQWRKLAARNGLWSLDPQLCSQQAYATLQSVHTRPSPRNPCT